MTKEEKNILPKKGLDLFAYRVTPTRFWLVHRQDNGFARITEYKKGKHVLTWESPSTPEEFCKKTKSFNII